MFHPLETLGNGAESIVAWEPGSHQGRVASVGEGTPYRATGAPDDFGLRRGAPLDPTFQGAYAPDVLCEGLLGLAVGCLDRLGGFAPGVKVTQLVRHLGQGLGDRRTAGPWPSGHDPCNGDFQSLGDRAQQRGEVMVRRGQHATGQEHRTRETSAEDPEDFMTPIGLEASESQDDPPLRLGKAPETRRVLEGEGDQFIIALQEIGDRTGREGHPTLDQRVMDCRNTTVGPRASGTNAGEDSEAKLMLGQGQTPFCCGPGGFPPLRTRRMEAAPPLEEAAHDGLQSRDGAVVVIGGPHGRPAAGTMAQDWL